MVVFLFFSIFQLILTAESRINIQDFYPFGSSHGDSELPANDDSSSGKIFLGSTLFPYFDQDHGSLYVNTNGAISFLVQISQYTPEAFPLSDNRRIIAPYWSDVDTRNCGQVFYRETVTQTLRERATQEIRHAFVKQQKFTATWLFIATWYNVCFYGTKNYNLKNSFQAVLATNGKASFAIFNYNKLQWTTGAASSGNDTTGRGGTPAQAGFNAGDGLRYFSIEGSRTDNVTNLVVKSNIGIPGKWIFQVDTGKVEHGGCNNKGSITTSPSSALMFGGVSIMISGPCYDPNDIIVCKFHDVMVNGTYIDGTRAWCPMPMLLISGEISLKVSTDGGLNFKYNGTFRSISYDIVPPAVDVLPQTLMWRPNNNITITWDPAKIQESKISIDLVQLDHKGDDISWGKVHSVAEEVQNSGTYAFLLSSVMNDNNPEDNASPHQVFLLPRVSTTGDEPKNKSIFGRLAFWDTKQHGASACFQWYNKQSNPDDYTIQPCPRTRYQALVDPRFIKDPGYSEKYHPGTNTCYRQREPSLTGAGSQCCYLPNGLLAIGQPGGGTLDVSAPVDLISYLTHWRNDILPWYDCCVASGNCGMYYEKRPSITDDSYEPVLIGGVLGDPHFMSLGDLTYTFNGHGEYLLVEMNNENSVLQARTEPLVESNGMSTKGTGVTALVIKTKGSDTVQVQLSDRRVVDVLVNNERVDFEELSSQDFLGVSVSMVDNTSVVTAVFAQEGILVEIIPTEGILSLILTVPQTAVKGSINGLLSPNATSTNRNTTSLEIHQQAGLKWAISSNDSLFSYELGQSHDSYTDPNYTPIFIDKMTNSSDSSLEAAAHQLCGENIECLFDVRVTKKLSIGEATIKTAQKIETLRNYALSGVCQLKEFSLEQGIVAVKETELGYQYNFQCHDSYQLIGQEVIECRDGLWVGGQAPTCNNTVGKIKKDSQSQKQDGSLHVIIPIIVIILIGIIVVTIVVFRYRKKQRQDTHSQKRNCSSNKDFINVTSNPIYLQPITVKATHPTPEIPNPQDAPQEANPCGSVTSAVKHVDMEDPGKKGECHVNLAYRK